MTLLSSQISIQKIREQAALLDITNEAIIVWTLEQGVK